MHHLNGYDDALQEVVSEAIERAGHVEAETPCGLELFDDLQREFPHATIMTMNLAALLEALDEAGEDRDG